MFSFLKISVLALKETIATFANPSQWQEPSPWPTLSINVRTRAALGQVAVHPDMPGLLQFMPILKQLLIMSPFTLKRVLVWSRNYIIILDINSLVSFYLFRFLHVTVSSKTRGAIEEQTSSCPPRCPLSPQSCGYNQFPPTFAYFSFKQISTISLLIHYYYYFFLSQSLQQGTKLSEQGGNCCVTDLSRIGSTRKTEAGRVIVCAKAAQLGSESRTRTRVSQFLCQLILATSSF